MNGFAINSKKITLNLNIFEVRGGKLNYLMLLSRFSQLERMMNKRIKVLEDWGNIKRIIEGDIDSIKAELADRIIQIKNANDLKNSFKVLRISIDVITQQNGSKFYRGRIKIPKEHRNSFNLKTPRKEFIIKRKEVLILLNRLNKKRDLYPHNLINYPKIRVNEKHIEDTALGRELQYLTYEKYINFIKSKFNID